MFATGAPAAAWIAASPATNARAGAATRPADAPRRLIDCHLHIGHLERDLPVTIAHVKGLGCDRAALLPLEDRARGLMLTTDRVLDAWRRYPDRVIPFCHVDICNDGFERRIEKYAAAGCRGYGEQKQQLPLDHPRIARMLEVVSGFNWPCTFHFQDGPRGFNQGIERHLEPLLKRFPRVQFIGHAQSWWSHISAEPPPPELTLYPRGRVNPGGLIDRLLADYENVHGDLSAGSGYGALARDEEFAAGFIRRHRTKLLFATDCPCHDGNGARWKGGCFGRNLIALLDRVADEATRADILHNNAARLFGLE